MLMLVTFGQNFGLDFLFVAKKVIFSRKIRSNKSCQKEVLERPKRQIGRKKLKLKLFILKR